MGSYRVIGSSRVGGVEPGGLVDLDPDVVNIEALVAGGHIEPASAEQNAAEEDPPPAGRRRHTPKGGASA